MTRYIHHWNIVQVENQNQKWFAVTGFIREISNEKPLVYKTNIKYITSSPITKIEGRNIYTESGNHYILEGKSIEFMESPGNTNPVPATIQLEILLHPGVH